MSRRQGFRWRAFLAPSVLLVCIGTLMALSVQTQMCAELRSRKSSLRRERQFQLDRQLQLRAEWELATKRESIVPRALAELGMVDQPTLTKEIVALNSSSATSVEASSFAARIRTSLDRYGNVGAASAKENRP